MPGAVRASLPLLLLALLLAVARAHANPHVWVEAVVTFEFEEHRVTGLAFAWRFDEYYSSHTNRSFDRDGDGTLGTAETEALRTETFDPLARFDYYVHVWAGSGRREGHAIDRFAAKIDEDRLVVEFPIPVTPPASPNDGSLIVSLFDPKNVVDFRFAESDFLLVDG
ncbi:MAG: DUF1007 family protein, partial [Rhodococcus sp.]|nr:DUF1007 family protein [Rhodococcus sp. (in: high G+C Gram-positive bacteria)]